MTIRFENLTAQHFEGWLTASCANPPSGVNTGTVLGFPAVLGASLGTQGRVLHVLADLPPGSILEGQPAWNGEQPNLPVNSASFFSVLSVPVPKVNRVPLTFVNDADVPPVGPSIVHFRGRISRMLVADLWVRYMPGIYWAPFELLITASNPSIPDMTEMLNDDLTLTFNGAVVTFLGNGFAPAMRHGDFIGDGQARAFLGTIDFVSYMNPQEQETAYAYATGGVGMVDLDWQNFIGPLKRVADAPRAWDGRLWMLATYTPALRRLQTWEDGPLGIEMQSGDSGEQEDQCYGGKGTAIFTGGGFGAVQTLRLVAMGWAKRPCHFLEADGSPLRLDIPQSQSGLCLWSGRPISWCADQRGKPRGITTADTHGWSGPDNQHDLINTLGDAYQLTGSPLLHRLLDAQARVFWYSQTLDPALATSMVDASRAWGWEGLKAAWLWITLQDRSLAQRIKDRFTARVAIYRGVAVPGRPLDVRPNALDSTGNMIGAAAEVWSDPTTPTPFPSFWLSYQQAVAAGGLQIAGEVLGIQQAMDLALELAQFVVDHCYQQDGTEWEMLGVRPDWSTLQPSEFVEGRGAHRTGFYATAWMPWAPWTVLRHFPTDARALMLYQRARDTAYNAVPKQGDLPKALDWIPAP